MSEVRLVIRDRERAISGTVHGSVADRLVAALTSEPETIAELVAAFPRYQGGDTNPLAGFHPGVDDEPWDAGLVVIDLAARLLAYESSYSSPCMKGVVVYHDGRTGTDTCLRYELPADWLVTTQVIDWDATADARRARRLAEPPQDKRAILYGRPLLEFIGRECFGLASCGKLAAPSSGVAREQMDGHACTDQEYAAIGEVHARWLLTPRTDLRGQTPRQVLFEHREQVSADLERRASEWSFLGRCPPVLSQESFAYRYGGVGTHEWVEYYYLIRHLLWSSLDAARAAIGKTRALTAGDFLMSEVPRLEAAREQWLDEPDFELHARTPRSIIENERRRLPEVMGAEEGILDHDCPLCQMMNAELPGPMFWHLDGCNMDDGFAFSYHEMQEEYDQERAEWAEWTRKFNEREAERANLGLEEPSVWKRCFIGEEPPDMPLVARLFGIGACVAELVVELKAEAQPGQTWIDRLNRDFGNLREVAQSSDLSLVAGLLEPVLERFGESLAALGAERESLARRCDDLQSQLERLLIPAEPLPEYPRDYPSDFDIPF